MNMSRILGLFQDLIGFLIYYSRVDVGANRVNLAIVSRPIIGIRDGSDAFFNIYVLANEGTDVGAIITAHKYTFCKYTSS
ncbi:hypothetical protein B5Y32_07720 [Campylobacter jejuni]|uniref:Uncharacterized protein n=1 Tax=Campylobacter jejuni TaxID=197 RepID=A0AAX0NJ19_CAMJU|nr:hypothetical protein B5Y32_07720 [Campylobacter jejuni]